MIILHDSLNIRPLKVCLVQAIVSSLLFLILGLSITLWLTITNVTQDAKIQLQYAQQSIERSLDSARQIASTAASSLDKPCHKVVQKLRMLVELSPEISSIDLARGNHIYCSTLLIPGKESTDFDGSINNQISLIQNNSTTQEQPLILYRETVGGDVIGIKLSAHHLTAQLDALSIRSPLSILIGRNKWTYEPSFSDQLLSLDTSINIEQSSDKYPFRVITNMSLTSYAENIRRYSLPNITVWFFFSLILGYWVFKRSRRVSLPRQELLRALEHRQFIPYIQAVVTAEGDRWIGCEILLRWQHPQKGIISPDIFIPMAEQCGLLVPMTRRLMIQIREQFAPQKHQLPKGFHFAFNISASHCKDFTLVDDCRDFINAFHDHPIKLILELTEQELLIANDVTHQLIEELHKLGVLIAIDDFGTGNSNLKYLQKLKIDFLKIDKSFVSMIETDPPSRHIVDNIIDLAARLNLWLVAEGVEDEYQAAYLKNCGVDYLQGYLYSKPIPTKEFISTLLNRTEL